MEVTATLANVSKASGPQMQSASTMITTSGGSEAIDSKPKSRAYPLPLRSVSWRSIAVAPQLRAISAVSSVQLSAMTRRRSWVVSCGNIVDIVAAIPAASL